MLNVDDDETTAGQLGIVAGADLDMVSVFTETLALLHVVGVDAFVADKDENYIPIPAAYEVYTTFKNLDDYGFMNHPEDIFIGKDNLLYVADTENNRVLVMNHGYPGGLLEGAEITINAIARLSFGVGANLDAAH